MTRPSLHNPAVVLLCFWVVLHALAAWGSAELVANSTDPNASISNSGLVERTPGAGPLGTISQILGIVSFGLAVYNTIRANIHDPVRQDRVVLVSVASGKINPAYDPAVRGTGGKAWVRTFDIYGQGTHKEHLEVDSGDATKQSLIKLPHDKHGMQTPIIKITAGGDVDQSLCIAWLAIRWPDGASYVWDGSFGAYCGQLEWYPQANILGSIEYADGSIKEHAPYCTWIGPGFNEAADIKGFSVYMPAFTTATKNMSEIHKDRLCNAPWFSLYSNAETGDEVRIEDSGGSQVIQGMPGNDSKTPARRSTAFLQSQSSPRGDAEGEQRARKWVYTADDKYKNIVVADSSGRVSARELCEHPLSAGPSFISIHDGKFCHMATKVLYGLCSTPLMRPQHPGQLCFDEETMTLFGHGTGLQRRSAYSFSKRVALGDFHGSNF